MVTTVMFIPVKIARKHLLPIAIVSIENCNGASPESFNGPGVIGLWLILDQSFP